MIRTARTRVFDGKRYELYGTFSTQRETNLEKGRLQREGFYVRTTSKWHGNAGNIDWKDITLWKRKQVTTRR